MDSKNEMVSILEGQYEALMDVWSELEDVIIQANKQAGFRMEEDEDNDFLLKLSAISVFVSRIQYILHGKLKDLLEKIEKLEGKKTIRDIKIPVGK